MRFTTYPVLASIIAATASAHAAVTLTFVHPELYTDATLYGGYGEKAREPALREIEGDLRRLAERYLKAGQTLSVVVLDVDLAGRLEPWHSAAYGLRYLRETTWPRIKVRYRLEGAAQPPLAAEETVTDLMYLSHRDARFSSDAMAFEKAMLEDWFRTRFVKRLPPRT